MNHNDHIPPHDGGLPVSGTDLFAPEAIDQSIARLLAPKAPDGADADAQLVRALAVEHTLPPEADATLLRVAARLAREPIAAPGSTPRGVGTGGRDASTHVARASHLPPRALHNGARTRNSNLLRSIAAVLVVGLLVSGFLAVLRLKAVPGTPALAWHDVSLSASRAGKLPPGVNLARGITYAVASDGTIYACSQNDVWYSKDGGQSYQTFAPALAPLFVGTPSPLSDCAIATVPGAPGLFASIPNPHAIPTSQAPPLVAYATPGQHDWQVLPVPTSEPTIGQPGFGIDVDFSRLWRQVATNSDGTQARADGNAFFVLLPYVGKPYGITPLVGTPDFGHTWEWFDKPVEDQGQTCVGMAVDPTDPSHVFCGTGQPGGAASGIAEAQDGGKTWQSAGLSGNGSTSHYAVIGATARTVYAERRCPDCQGAPPVILRRALSGGSWQSAGSLGTATSSASLVGVMADDSVYAQHSSRVDAHHYLVQALRLAPGATQFRAVGPNMQLPYTGRVVFTLGGIGDGAQPAMYVHAQLQPSTEPLYRLALPATGVAAQVDTTPQPFAPTPSPTTYPCSASQSDLDTIQPGGLGADISAFAPRWGDFQGFAAGTWSFGKYADSGQPIMEVAAPAPNHRILFMSYQVDTTVKLSLASATTLALTILPADVTQQGALQAFTDNHSGRLVAVYCSPAYGAAFPVGTQSVDAQGVTVTLTGSGLVSVIYYQRPDGSIASIAIGGYAPPS